MVLSITRSSRFSSPKVRDFFDESPRDIRERTKQTPDYRARAELQIRSHYQGMTKQGIVLFSTPSGTTPGKIWHQRISMLELKTLRKKYKGKKKPLEIVRMALKSDVAVHCDDPSFHYWGFKYIAWKYGFGLQKEVRSPVVRNPRLQGALCKHLEQVVRNLPFHASSITRDLKKNGFLK